MKSKPTDPVEVVLGELAAIAAHKTMPSVKPLSDAERERRRQKLKRDLEFEMERRRQRKGAA